MAYSTLSTLKSLQPEKILLMLADDTGAGAFVETPSPGNVAFQNVTSAIDDADAVIDTYLGGRYEVPVSAPIPAIVRQMSANIALCNLYERKREMDIPEGIAARRKQYMEILRDIKAEKADIPELSQRSPSSFQTDKEDEDRIFTDDVLETM